MSGSSDSAKIGCETNGYRTGFGTMPDDGRFLLGHNPKSNPSLWNTNLEINEDAVVLQGRNDGWYINNQIIPTSLDIQNVETNLKKEITKLKSENTKLKNKLTDLLQRLEIIESKI